MQLSSNLTGWILCSRCRSADASAKANGGSFDGLASDTIQKVHIYTDNGTVPISQNTADRRMVAFENLLGTLLPLRLSFNSLGDDKRANKHADLAVQAGIVEQGADANDVTAIKIMVRDVRVHSSYRYALRRRE
ncbi:hypothetical protein VTH06DRAFT_7618 [Thermothelomyces fergusii]